MAELPKKILDARAKQDEAILARSSEPPKPLAELINQARCRARANPETVALLEKVLAVRDEASELKSRGRKARQWRVQVAKNTEQALRQFVYSGVSLPHAVREAGVTV